MHSAGDVRMLSVQCHHHRKQKGCVKGPMIKREKKVGSWVGEPINGHIHVVACVPLPSVRAPRLVLFIVNYLFIFY